MPSRVIRPTAAPAAAPFAYTVGGVESLAPEAVFASWDGSGAFGDFLPCVSYYSAEGVLLDRAFPTTGAVTAGDTAEVSYRPFERGGGGSAPAPPVPLPLIYARGQRPIGAYPSPEFPLLFNTAASHGVTVGPHSWTIQTAGVYQLNLWASLTLDGPAAAGALLGAFRWINGHTLDNTMQFGEAIAAGAFWEFKAVLAELVTLAVGDVIQFGVGHFDGTPTLGGPIMSIALLGV